MPVLEHDNAIKQYYEEVKELYPDIDFDRFRLVCRSPWIYVKNCIKSITFAYNIRIKYLGVINLYTGRIKDSMKTNQNSIRKGVITQEEYRNRQDYLERLENFVTNEKKSKEDCRVDKEVEIVE